MDIQQVLRWIMITIVMLIAMALLSVMFNMGTVLLQLALKVLVALLLIAIILRFVNLLRQRR